MQIQTIRRLGIIIVLLGIVALLYYLDVSSYFSLENLRTQSMELQRGVQHNYLLAVLVYMAIYTALISFTVPIVGPLTLIGGFLFGVVPATVYAIISATIGSVISFLLFRYLLSDMIRGRYAQRLEIFNKQIHEHGASYLLMLHFMTVVPFFIINSLAALTDVSLITLIWTTIIGLAPLAFIYAFAGRQLGSIDSVGDIFSLPVILAFLLLIALSLVPIIIKKIKQRRMV